MSLTVLQSTVKDGAQNPMDRYIEERRKLFLQPPSWHRLAAKRIPSMTTFPDEWKGEQEGSHSFFNHWGHHSLPQHSPLLVKLPRVHSAVHANRQPCPLHPTPPHPPPPPPAHPEDLPEFLIFCSKWTGDMGKWKRICRQCETNEVDLLVRTGASKQTNKTGKVSGEHRSLQFLGHSWGPALGCVASLVLKLYFPWFSFLTSLDFLLLTIKFSLIIFDIDKEHFK